MKNTNQQKQEFLSEINSLKSFTNLIEKKNPKVFNGASKTLDKIYEISFKDTPNDNFNKDTLNFGRFVIDSIPHLLTITHENKTRKEIINGSLDLNRAIKRANGEDISSFINAKLIETAINIGSNPNTPNGGDFLKIALGYDSGINAINFAITNNNFNALKTLIKSKGNLNISTNGDYPIHHAFSRLIEPIYDRERNGDILKKYVDHNRDLIQNLIIDKTKDIHVKNALGSTILHEIAMSRTKVNPAILHKIFNMNPDVNSKDHTGSTPLHIASNVGNLYFINMLSNKKIDINSKNKNGLTPLHLAALANESDCFDKLIKLGANPNILDSRGKKPFYYFENDKHILKYRIVLPSKEEAIKMEKRNKYIEEHRNEFKSLNLTLKSNKSKSLSLF